MEKIGVFCSASATIKPEYFEAARELGQWLGVNGKTLVYGGASLGLMEAMAKEVKGNGGKVYGMVPQILQQRGNVSEHIDITFHCDNLSDRKDLMLLHSDILVALPGGVGTLDEVFSVMAAATIGYHRKRVVFLNIGGFWNPILRFLEQLAEENFLRKESGQLYAVAEDMEQLKVLLEE